MKTKKSKKDMQADKAARLLKKNPKARAIMFIGRRVIFITAIKPLGRGEK